MTHCFHSEYTEKGFRPALYIKQQPTSIQYNHTLRHRNTRTHPGRDTKALSAATLLLALPPRRYEATYDEPCAPRRRLQEGYDTGAPPPPDPRIRVSPGATRRAMRAATTPSRRERASPPPVRPKIEQVFPPANTHHHRTPAPATTPSTRPFFE